MSFESAPHPEAEVRPPEWQLLPSDYLEALQQIVPKSNISPEALVYQPEDQFVAEAVSRLLSGTAMHDRDGYFRDIHTFITRLPGNHQDQTNRPLALLFYSDRLTPHKLHANRPLLIDTANGLLAELQSPYTIPSL